MTEGFNFHIEKRKLMMEWAKTTMTINELLEEIEELEEKFVEKLKEDIHNTIINDNDLQATKEVIDKLFGKKEDG